jgi:hypothetical protein
LARIERHAWTRLFGPEHHRDSLVGLDAQGKMVGLEAPDTRAVKQPPLRLAQNDRHLS